MFRRIELVLTRSPRGLKPATLWRGLKLALPLHLLAANLALAQEHAEHETPSLFGGDLGNAVWTLIIFFLVLAVLSKFAWGPLLAALQKREKFIQESLAAAKRSREEAEARLREYEERLLKAREEASRIVEEGRRDAEVVKRRIEEEARKAAEASLERAKREIGIARDTALKELYVEAAELVTNLAGTVLRRQLTPGDHQRLVQEALAELRPKSNGRK